MCAIEFGDRRVNHPQRASGNSDASPIFVVPLCGTEGDTASVVQHGGICLAAIAGSAAPPPVSTGAGRVRYSVRRSTADHDRRGSRFLLGARSGRTRRHGLRPSIASRRYPCATIHAFTPAPETRHTATMRPYLYWSLPTDARTEAFGAGSARIPAYPRRACPNRHQPASCGIPRKDQGAGFNAGTPALPDGPVSAAPGRSALRPRSRGLSCAVQAFSELDEQSKVDLLDEI